MKKICIVSLVLCLVCTAVFAKAAGEKPFPSKDITLIVPWGAGGSSDLVGRRVTDEMSKIFGVKISVVNTPGATGTVGMNDCLLKPHDGYTLIANATPHTHYVNGLADWSPKDWDYLAAYYVPCVIAVSKNSKYKTFNDLYKALKDNPANTIKNSVAGIGSSGYNAVMVLSATDAVMGKGLNTPYAGGADAIKALLAGEVDFTSQLSNEMIDLLRSGDLVALCSLTEENLVLEGVSKPIPSIKTFIPELAKSLPIGDAFGLMFPSDVPDGTKKALESAFVKACQTDSVKAFAGQKGMILLGSTIAESNELKDKAAAAIGFTLYDLGIAKRSPQDLGYKR
ncbi:tripartite tricarboxylate transporter substrate binding protein [Treponema parvum]|uniref:Tripartite tricarboxylate transporter substrate binding protein n=1 Tax=Treponema parvum TaxID=138851 RepID=A0A975IDW8_9SPIR|nr:tripartite tricarboxylate transporter substrate binding protein [Treponema parvum]QTQ12644.1 tripartite tricarboxylate transporter substrate binding protein [Treponema parvum]QTQ15379.1 tripartite tricarboxylate transporter substrate binding protein [Treponema parvum]